MRAAAGGGWPLWLWIASAVVAAIALLVFVALVTYAPSQSHEPPMTSGSNFSVGVILGLAAGVAIGWAMGRRAKLSD